MTGTAHYSRLLLFFAWALLAAAVQGAGSTTPALELVSSTRIWDQAPHNGFTDLTEYKGTMYCAFREGAAHVSPGGKVRVIASTDGTSWTSRALLDVPDHDLRDAKFICTPEGHLIVQSGATVGEGKKTHHETYSWWTEDGQTWKPNGKLDDLGLCLWRTSWLNGTGYCVGYVSKSGPDHVSLLSTPDGLKYSIAADKIYDVGNPSEACLAFDETSAACCLLRRDSQSKSTLLGAATPPYQTWAWKDTGVQVGGPAMLRLPSGALIAGARSYVGGTHTALMFVNPEAGQLNELLKLPSSGDTGYPGLLLRDGVLWVSYYSTEEGKTSIHLAKVNVPAKK